MQNLPSSAWPGSEREPDIARAIQNALAHAALWSQTMEIRIRQHLRAQRHAPEKRCPICTRWNALPTFPSSLDTFRQRLGSPEGPSFIRQHFNAPETIHEILSLCLWRSWMSHGQRVLVVELADAASLPKIPAGSRFPDPAPHLPVLFAIRTGTASPQLVFVEDGRGFEGLVELSRIAEGVYGASLAKEASSPTLDPRRFFAMGVRPACLEDPSPFAARIEKLRNAFRDPASTQKDISQLPDIELSLRRYAIEPRRQISEQPTLIGGVLNPIHLVRITGCLGARDIGPGISRLEDVAPELARNFRTGPSFRPVPPRFQTPDGPRDFAIPGWKGPLTA